MAEINVDPNKLSVVVPAETVGQRSDWVAAFLSYGDLLAALGTTDERDQGYMILNSPTDLFSRLYSTQTTGWWIETGEETDEGPVYSNETPDEGSDPNNRNWPNGPYTTFNGTSTGWGHEFDAVANYLAYGGRCFVAGRPDNLPSTVNNGKEIIENTNNVINCVFSEEPSKNNTIIEIGQNRSCMSICQVDVKAPVSSTTPNGLPTTETEQSRNTFHVAGQKRHLGAFSSFTDGDDTSSNLRTTGVAADVAGLMARVRTSKLPYGSPAGTSNPLLGAISMEYDLTSDDRKTLATSFVNPIESIPGFGFCLFGDRTGNTETTQTSFNYVNVSLSYEEINRQITDVLKQYMFVENIASNRSALTSALQTILRKFRSANAISEYSVICNDINNPPDIVLAGKLIVDITISFVLSVQNISLRYQVLDGTQTVQSSASSGSGSGSTSTSGGGSSTSSGSSY